MERGRGSEEVEEQRAETVGRFAVRSVANPVEDGEARAWDAGRNGPRSIRAGRIQRSDHNESGRRDAGQSIVKRLHCALPGAAEGGGQTGGLVVEASGVEAVTLDGGHRALGAEHRKLLPAVDEGLDPVAIEELGQLLIGGAAGGAVGRIGDPGGGAFEEEASDHVRFGDGHA